MSDSAAGRSADNPKIVFKVRFPRDPTLEEMTRAELIDELNDLSKQWPARRPGRRRELIREIQSWRMERSNTMDEMQVHTRQELVEWASSIGASIHRGATKAEIIEQMWWCW